MSVTITAESLTALIDGLVEAGLAAHPAARLVGALDEVRSLRSQLRALTEVGEPPEGFDVNATGDLMSENLQIVAKSGGRVYVEGWRPATGEASSVVTRLDCLLHFAAVQRARQAQAALDGAATFRVGGPRENTLGIIAVEILEDADTESEAGS